MCGSPHEPTWMAALHKARLAPRCGARNRAGLSCEAPAMPNGRCYRHGGASTGPRTAEGLARVRRSTWKHGNRSAERVALRRLIAESGRKLRELNRVSREMLKNAGRS